MIDNKTQVLPPRVLFPHVSSTTFHSLLPDLLPASSISPFSSSSCSASLASPFFRFASLVPIRSFSPHCIVAFFYWCGDLFKSLPSPHRVPSLPFLLLTHSHFHYYPRLFVHHHGLVDCLLLSLPLHSTRCLLRCVLLSVQTTFHLM